MEPKELAEYLQHELPPEINTRYDADDLDCGPMPLMPPGDVADSFDMLRDFANLRGSVPFFRGWNTEYAAVYLAGPLSGRVYFWNYDGRHDSIAYRSITSFVDAMVAIGQAQQDWYAAPPDYYVPTQYFQHGTGICRPADAADIQSDANARDALRAEYETADIRDERDDHHYAFNIMALTPPEETASILEFLDSDDMWIQERACEVLGIRQYAPAIDRLADLAVNGLPNSRTAAPIALGRIGTPESRKALSALNGLPEWLKKNANQFWMTADQRRSKKP